MARWSTRYNTDACGACGSSEHPHAGRGLCKRCYRSDSDLKAIRGGQRRKRPSKRAIDSGQDVGTYSARAAAWVADQIDARGWDVGAGRSIGHYATLYGPMGGPALMESLRIQVKSTVVAWESAPGRSQAQVVALLRRVAGLKAP